MKHLTEEFYKKKESHSFIRNGRMEVGDKVIINFNPCGVMCGCYWHEEKEPRLEENKVYTIKKINLFGGGCPPVMLILEGINEEDENSLLGGYPGNWFKIK